MNDRQCETLERFRDCLKATKGIAEGPAAEREQRLASDAATDFLRNTATERLLFAIGSAEELDELTGGISEDLRDRIDGLLVAARKISTEAERLVEAIHTWDALIADGADAEDVAR